MIQPSDEKRGELYAEMMEFLLRCTHNDFANCVEFVLNKTKADEYRKLALKDGKYIRTESSNG